MSIIAVAVATAMMIAIMLRAAKNAERAEKDPKFLRRMLLGFAVLYGFGLLSGIERVFTGQAPVWSLAFSVIPLFVIWLYVRAAKHAKQPPPES